MYLLFPTIVIAKKFHMTEISDIPSLPRINEKRVFDSGKRPQAMHYVIGVDEAGRGPLAGPVVAAAFVILPTRANVFPVSPPSLSNGITDSKQVTESLREFVYYKKIQPCDMVKYSFSVISNEVIDEINILQATFLAMTEAVDALISTIRKTDPSASFAILIDGNKVPPQLRDRSDLVCESLIKGDSIEFVIAAASICAKVERDHIMHEIDTKFPEYGFKQHKGYGTGGHVAAISKHGPCKHHRMTFAPLKNIRKNDKPKKKEIPTALSERDLRAMRRGA